MTGASLCRTCGKIISYVEPGLDPAHHVTCGPNLTAEPTFSEPEGPKPFDLAMKRELTDITMWGWRGDERSQQKLVGPSELGDPCDRKLAFRIAGLPVVNHYVDPWPALVGTAIHKWFENTINDYQEFTGKKKWLTEVTVHPDDLVVGHCDLFDVEPGAVWDLKTMNTDRLKQFATTGQAPQPFRVQTNLYGLGMERAGYEVGSVGLIAVPRSGWLSQMYVWSEPYNEQIAKDALSRLYSIAERTIELAVDEYPQQVMAIEATPSRLCTFCDFYTPNLVDGNGVGCPGK